MNTKTNLVVAGIIAAVHATFPALVLLGVVHISGDAQAAVELAIGSYVTLGGLVVALFVAGPAMRAPAPPIVSPQEQSPVAAVAAGIAPVDAPVAATGMALGSLPGASSIPPRGQ